jgi:DNA-binding transcriptional MerR regulator
MDKSPDAFRTISEVAEDLDLPQHVLRFWETRFSQIRPLKRGGGRRYYRPDDVDLLKGIRHLLYGEGYTIKGVQRILKAEGVRFVQGVGRGEESVAPPPDMQAEAATETAAPAAPPEPALPAQVLQRLRYALDELREADRMLGTLTAAEPLGD